MTRTERVSDLLAITSRLIACMEQEVALLKRMRAQDIGPVQASKVALADAYEAHLAALRDGTGAEEPIDSALVQELTTTTERLQAAITENLRAVRAAREVNDKVLKAIVAAVQADQAKPSAYGRGGAAAAAAAARRSTVPVSVSLDGRF
jgi:flagellar biosynthesis/type III secretory pathway chaperone